MEDFSAIPFSPREGDVEFIEALSIYELEMISQDVMLGDELRKVTASREGVKMHKGGFIRNIFMRLFGLHVPDGSPKSDLYVAYQVSSIISNQDSGVMKLKQAINLMNSKQVDDLSYSIDNRELSGSDMVNRSAMGRLLGYVDQISLVLSGLASMRLSRLSQAVSIEVLDKMREQESEGYGPTFYENRFKTDDESNSLEPVCLLIMLLGCSNSKQLYRASKKE